MGEIMALITDSWIFLLVASPVAFGGFWYWRKRGGQLLMHDVMFLCGDMSIAHARLEVATGLLVNHKLRTAWFLDLDALIEDEDGKLHIILTDDSAVPHYPGRPASFRQAKATECCEARTGIAEQYLDQASIEVEEEGPKDRFAAMGTTVALAALALIAVIVLVGVVSSDMMPWA